MFREIARDCGRHVLFIIVLMGLELVTVPAEAAAQALPAPTTPLSLIARLLVAEEFTDNVFFDSPAREDFLTFITPGLGTNYQSQYLSVYATLAATARFSAYGTVDNGINLLDAQNAQLGTSYRATERLTLSVYDGVRRVGRTRAAINLGGTTEPTTVGTQPPPSQEEPAPPVVPSSTRT